mmetsp:Transcript_50834/g.102176  ORF Transcript_50834/g.102176 Transcript_50834/m.102176 type:complete len:254 (-) Transcript_50834:376-1137(-)
MGGRRGTGGRRERGSVREEQAGTFERRDDDGGVPLAAVQVHFPHRFRACCERFVARFVHARARLQRGVQVGQHAFQLHQPPRQQLRRPPKQRPRGRGAGCTGACAVELELEAEDVGQVGALELLHGGEEGVVAWVALVRLQHQTQHAVGVQIKEPNQRAHRREPRAQASRRQSAQQHDELGVPFRLFSQQVVLLLPVHGVRVHLLQPLFEPLRRGHQTGSAQHVAVQHSEEDGDEGRRLRLCRCRRCLQSGGC